MKRFPTVRRPALFAPALILCSACLAAPCVAGNWPQWRGPAANGISEEKDVPVRWTNKENVAWRFELPGRGGATPAVWDDHIFVTSVEEDGVVLICIKSDGTELWRRTLAKGNRVVRSDEGDSASPSPCTDGKCVWAMATTGDNKAGCTFIIACFDFGGQEIWKLDLRERYGPFNIQFGMTSTPVLFEDRLLCQFIHGDMRGPNEEAFVAALDKMTGKEIWKTDRFTKAEIENRQSYASPSLYQEGDKALFITHGGDYVVAYDAHDGKEVWRCGGLNRHDDPKKRYHETLRFVSSPVVAEGMIIVPTAKNEKVIAIKPDGSGDITEEKSAHIWERPANTPDVPSPLVHDGLVYLCRENGNLLCLDAKTGEELYEKRTFSDRYRSSPVYANGHIYLTSRRGVVSVIKTGRKFEKVAENNLDEEMSASPAISGGTLYLRTFDALWAIRE